MSALFSEVTQAEARASQACETFLRALIAYPSQARTAQLMPAPDFVGTMDAVFVYDAVCSAVRDGKDPTPFALRVRLEEAGASADIMRPYLTHDGTPLADAQALAERAIAAHKSERIAGEIKRAADKGQLEVVSAKASEAAQLSLRDQAQEVGAREFLASSVETFFRTPRALTFGWRQIDDVCRAYPGDLVIVAADSGIGKSSVILQVMLHNARQGLRSTYLSVEDSVDVFGSRFLSMAGGIDRRKFVKGEMSSEDAAGMQRVASEACLLENVKFVDCTSLSVDQLCAQIRLAASRGSKFVCVDYFQAIAAEGRFGSDVERKNVALEKIILATKQTGVVCLLASQVRNAPAQASKPGEAETAREPKLEDLLGTGNLRRRAQIVLMLWGQRGSTIHCRIAKSKTSSLGESFTLVPDPETGLLKSDDTLSPLEFSSPWGGVNA